MTHTRSSRIRWGAVVLVLGAMAPLALTAQRPPLTGRVLDASDRGAPVRDAAVELRIGAARATRAVTNAGGRFTLARPAASGMLVVTRLGFAPESLVVSARDSVIVVRMTRAAFTLDPAIVRAEQAFSAASSGAARELDLALRPRESSQDLLRLAPGLVIAQHGGGGKAEQIFLRGFDADHGTDVAITVDGVPVNMVSHGHGQGYADLHFLLPEVVERVDVRKGPYDVRDGDFATAGAVAFHTRDRLDGARFAARAGSFGAGRMLAAVPFGADLDGAGGYAAVSVATTRGPFEVPQGHHRVNGFAKATMPIGHHDAYASLSAFAAEWRQSGQVPERAVASGMIGRYGSIDPSEGGATERHDLRLGIRSRAGDVAEWDAHVFAARYRFGLFSNFTFFLEDSVDGDGIGQTDDRVLGGAAATYRRRTPMLGVPGGWLVGTGARADDAEVALFGQRARRRGETRVAAHVRQHNAYAYVQRELDLGATAVQIGARWDGFRFAVRDSAAAVAMQGALSPKLNVRHQLTPGLALFGNAGFGFHSNDARDVVQAGHGDRVLPRATGADAGARYVGRAGTVAASTWLLDLQSELVYVGDEGVTEANGATRRIGVDLEARAALGRWIVLDADLNLARGRFRDLPPGVDRIPLAPTRTASAGVTVRDAGPASASVRYRHIGSRAANEDASVIARGSDIVELLASYQVRGVTMYGAVDNLFGARWNEAQFATTSRLRLEPAAVTELHFTPGAPRGVQLGVQYRF